MCADLTVLRKLCFSLPRCFVFCSVLRLATAAAAAVAGAGMQQGVLEVWHGRQFVCAGAGYESVKVSKSCMPRVVMVAKVQV